VAKRRAGPQHKRPGTIVRLRRLARNQVARTAFGLAVLAAIIGVLVVINRSSDGDGEETVLGPLTSDGPSIGQPAPDFVLAGTDGETHKLSDLHGQPVWINFWATWCPPCRGELPDIQKLFEEKGDDGLVVLAIDLEEPGDQAQDLFDGLGLTMPILLDSDGSIFEQYRLRGLPDSFFVDGDGILRDVQLGALTEEQMREKLESIGLP
jgi:cytochrome c biogenesis protein CcmG/thiol:disulfide interchange protein DsbE